MALLQSRPSLVARIGSVLITSLIVALAGLPSAHAQKDYEEWRKKQRQKYQEYLNEQDKAFLKFLKRQWKSVEVEAETGSPVDDKPSDIPTVGELDGGAEPSSSVAESSPTAETDPAPESSPESDQRERSTDQRTDAADPPPPPQTSSRDRPRSQTDAELGANASTASLRFFGVPTSVPYTSTITPSLDGEPGKESIRSFWRTMAKQEYAPTLEAVQAQRDELGLSDWGYYVYLRDLGNQLYQKNGLASGSNAATLWTWFMMMKSGYAVRVGYRSDNIFLLLPADSQIYNRPQMYLNDQRYYLMVEGGGGSLRTYEGQHEDADQVLRLDQKILPKLEGSTKQRSASFSYDGERYTVEFSYDTAVLAYLQAFPNVELSVLFRAGASPAAQSSLTESLRPHVENRSPRDALTFLLRFVQFATEYKRDRENFGEERFLFPEESLAVTASDCEDRAVLFAYLVRTVLDREVVGLEWPSHIATAVRVGEGLEAASEDRTLTVDGATYIMADPTYIGSSLGMEMPLVENKDPDIIQFAQN